MAVRGDLTFVCLPAVKGRDHLENDVFFASRGDRPSVNVVLFCGDVQNEFSVMSADPQFGGLAEKWSFEAVASLILSRLESVSGVHLWIVRASRWFLDTIACYTNFVRYNANGVPDYSGIHGIGGTSSAWRHLDALLKNAVAAVNGASAELPCVIIGFSKGGSVVTQLLYELGMFFDLPEFSDVNLTSQVVSLTWLDSGHNGVTHLWPTWTIPLARLRRCPSPPKLLVFATPYELCDENRPWNNRDFRTFICLLKSFRLPFYFDTFYKGHHWDYSFEFSQTFRVTIDSHFEILACFPIHLCMPTSSDVLS
ncbi:hypothetical protein TcWFU_007288 [Taenia crassiceps]|uniref:Uncharacterized protein n=1 Tax=Taenia crassiceps TaxID=6207 RepID=A0ABR4QLW2_9CEST